MGDEADADWEAGLVEWGEEDTLRWMREQQDRARHFARSHQRAQREARRLKRVAGLVETPGFGETK